MDGLVLCGGGVGVNGTRPSGETGLDKMRVGVGCALCALLWGWGRRSARGAHTLRLLGRRAFSPGT